MLSERSLHFFSRDLLLTVIYNCICLVTIAVHLLLLLYSRIHQDLYQRLCMGAHQLMMRMWSISTRTLGYHQLQQFQDQGSGVSYICYQFLCIKICVTYEFVSFIATMFNIFLLMSICVSDFHLF